MEPDIQVHDEGSIVLLMPMSGAGSVWIIDNLAVESWQWYAGGVAVDHRYADNIIEGMVSDGLLVT